MPRYLDYRCFWLFVEFIVCNKSCVTPKKPPLAATYSKSTRSRGWNRPRCVRPRSRRCRSETSRPFRQITASSFQRSRSHSKSLAGSYRKPGKRVGWFNCGAHRDLLDTSHCTDVTQSDGWCRGLAWFVSSIGQSLPNCTRHSAYARGNTFIWMMLTPEERVITHTALPCLVPSPHPCA